MAYLTNTGGYACHDLSKEWRSCCLAALGFYEESLDVKAVPIVNLLAVDHPEPPRAPVTPWMQTALAIQSNIADMRQWIDDKKYDYVSVEMPEEEASLIQSTVGSFTATTAAEIESLRHVLGEPSHYQQHQTGIVQILLADLKEHVADPFARLSKQRSRMAVRLWQNPLHCRLVVPRRPKTEDLDTLLGIDDDDSRDQRFLPKRLAHRLQAGFWETYSKAPFDRPLRPNSRLWRRKRPPVSPSSSPSAQADLKRKRQTPPMVQPRPADASLVYTQPHELQQESALLLAAAENELDTVQQMETRMLDITQLLSQFAALVEQQSHDVSSIRDATSHAKSNVAEGQEQLVEAKERTKKSRHWMASSITGMAVVLLLLHWIRP